MAQQAHPSPLFRRYIASTRPYWRYIYVAIALMLIIVAITMLLPQLFRLIIDVYIPAKDFSGLLYSCLGLLGLYLIRLGAFVLRNNRMLNFGYRYIYSLRNTLMSHFQLLSFRFYDRMKTGDIMNRMLDDVMNVEMMTTNSLIYLAEDLLMIVGVSIALFFLQPELTLTALTILPLYALIHTRFGKHIRAQHDHIRSNYAQLSSIFHETISGIKTVKSFTLEKYKQARFDDYSLKDRRLRIRTYTLNAVFIGVTEYLTIIGILAVLAGGGWLAIQARMTIGEIVAFYTYLGFLYAPIIRLSSTATIIEAGLSSVRRIYEVLDTPVDLVEKTPTVIPPAPVRGRIVFDNVSFKYPTSVHDAVHRLNFEVEPGTSVALVGHSGAGKSTILNLLTRFYDPTKGTIYLDRYDLRDVPLHWLRRNIALVLQEGFLFWGTVRDNIRLGDIEASDEAVEEAARLAYADEFIQHLPEGYDTHLAERGVTLSGGQRQRLAIARALLKNAPILILDEATSALDRESESKIQQALKRVMANRTTFIIAHRLSTIRHVDEIFVLDAGSLVERGAHEHLLATDSRYARLQGFLHNRDDRNSRLPAPTGPAPANEA